MSKNMQYVMKGITIVAALLASLLLIAPFMVYEGLVSSESINLFDAWDAGLDGAPAEYVIMTICYSVVFFLGLIMAVLALVGMFAKGEMIDKILKIVGIVLAVLVIVGLICNFVYINNAESAIGVGGILSAIFSVVAAAMVYAEKALK